MIYLKVSYLLHVLCFIVALNVFILYIVTTYMLILAPVPMTKVAIVIRWYNGFYLNWHLNNELHLYYIAVQTVLYKARLLYIDHLLIWIEKLPACLVMTDSCLKNKMAIVSLSCLMTYTEILANFNKLTKVMCVSKEERREELIPTLFPPWELEEF